MGMSEQLAEIKQTQEQQQKDIEKLSQNIKDLQATVKDLKSLVTQLGMGIVKQQSDIDALLPSIRSVVTAEHVRTIVAQEVARVKDGLPKCQPPIAEQDRELLNSNLLSLQRITGDHSLIYKIVFGCTIALVLFSLWTQYQMKNVVEEVNTNYDRTTAILSRDANYWFDGENYNIAQQSPRAEQLKKVLEEYKRPKTNNTTDK